MNAKTLLLLAATAAPLGSCATAPPVSPAPAPTYEQKLATILRLEDQRILQDRAAEPAPAPAPARARRGAAPLPPRPDALTPLLEDPEARVRRRAALAIGRVGLAEGIDPLSATLEDLDPEVREMAAFALGLIRDRAAVAVLVEALRDADARVQGRAAEALGLIGAADAAAAIGALAASKAGAASGIAPDDLSYPLAPDVEAFRLAIHALARLKAWEPLAAAVLDARGLPRVRWWPVAYALQRVEDARAAPALLWFLGQAGVEGAAFAARGLGALYAKPETAASPDAGVVTALLQAVESPDPRDPRVVVAAVRSLGQIGDRRAAGALLTILSRPAIDENLRIEIVSALGALRATEAVTTLIDLTGDRSPAVRGAAFTALAGADPESLLFALSSLDADPAWTVRAALAGALATLDPELVTPRLTAMLRDADARVVPKVLEALAKVGGPEIDAVLLNHLTHADAVVRGSAAALIGDRRPEAGPPALVQMYRRFRDEATYTARASALGALAKYGAGTATGILMESLSDPDWAVRRRAAELLRDLDPAADVAAIRPAPTRLAPDDYRTPGLVRPAYSPVAYMETAVGTIQVELAVLDAPLTVANFVALVRQGFFDGARFHRVVPNFVVQDGDPRGDGEGGPGYTIRDEINTRPYLRGTVGMALDWADTGGSQFFITHGPQPHLDGRYTVFGRVVAGQDVVDRISRDDPIEHVRIWDGVAWIEGPARSGSP